MLLKSTGNHKPFSDDNNLVSNLEFLSLELSAVQSIPGNEQAFPANIFRKISPYLVTPWFTLALAAMMVIIYLLDL